MSLERKLSRTVGRSISVRNPPTQRDRSVPAMPAVEVEPLDTALPPISSKQQMVTVRRHQPSERNQHFQNWTSSYANSGGHRRTGSTLKTVMRKIFTRNRRSRPGEIDDPFSDFRFGSNNPSFTDRNEDRSLGRSKSGSSRRSGQSRHDRQPLTTLDDVLRHLDNGSRPRRATLPSLILSDDGSRHALEAVIHPERRPSMRNFSPHANSDPEEVQRRQIRNIKRRSRSAGALRTLAKQHRMSPIQWRRPRSVESDYGATTTYDMASDSEPSRPPTRTTVASVSKPSAEMSVFEEDEPEDEPSLAPSVPPSLPPNVGGLISSMQNDEDASLEQRLTTLEVKLIDLEFAIARMQGGRGETQANSPAQKNTQEPARNIRQKSSGHSPSSGDDCSVEHAIPDRPLSTSTIRPSLVDIQRARALQAPSMVSLGDSGAISVQQYSALVMLLRREQSARRNLEQQVSSLREDIERLNRVARDSIGVRTMYPISSFDSHDFLRSREAESRHSSPRHTSEKLSRYESDSDRMSEPTKDDRCRPWQATRRIEIANMI
ncbi:hypothetical protein BJX61DRAFT_123769 [Aspergillus egyptiacus]|nr:hypothetical protein BJX61DRAFT_123769 [Aspergillus egyptiacus]